MRAFNFQVIDPGNNRTPKLVIEVPRAGNHKQRKVLIEIRSFDEVSLIFKQPKQETIPLAPAGKKRGRKKGNSKPAPKIIETQLPKFANP